MRREWLNPLRDRDSKFVKMGSGECFESVGHRVTCLGANVFHDQSFVLRSYNLSVLMMVTQKARRPLGDNQIVKDREDLQSNRGKLIPRRSIRSHFEPL